MAATEADDQAVFEGARKIAPGTARDAYVQQMCGEDVELRNRVGALLGAFDQSESFLESPPPGLEFGSLAGSASPTVDRPIAERPGAVIGPYKLLQQIGEGGMGVVFMAEQTEPLQRTVALKIIKPGMDTRQVIARFEAERQAVAMMDHPNIAKVLDAGATESGRPYFVMELVKGVPITKYCDDKQLPIRARLELFTQVCQAVQHAHQKGVIHRDLKPNNVLVAEYDNRAVPKVIDFGVAKATAHRLTERTMFTEFGQVLGTMEYMSPEQAKFNQLDVDTRSDIYSLGVLLYELLAGSTPFEGTRLHEAAFDEMLRIIREEEPPKPSTRLSSLSLGERDQTSTGDPKSPERSAVGGREASGVRESLASVAANRHTEPARLSKDVRGELDWIVMKALEKDRNRRYESASAFAAEIDHYLRDEPVQACPPSAAYRFRKFVRRHKAKLATTSVVAVALLFAVGSLGWAMRDRTARHAKVAGQVELILSEMEQLEREQKWAEALLAARRADAVVIGGEADAATAQRVRQRLQDLEFLDHLEQIRMQQTTIVDDKFDLAGADRDYARAFRDYGVDVGALAVEASIDRLKARPALVIPLAAALDDWVFVRRKVSEKDAARWKPLVAVARGIDAEPLRDRLRSTWGQSGSETEDELRRLAESIDVRAQHPATLLSLARTLQGVKQSDSALRLLRNAQSVYPGDFWLNFELGIALSEQKDHDGAVRFYTAAASIRPRSSAVHSNLGTALADQKEVDEAIACYKRAIELDPKIATAYSNLGDALREQKRLDDAVDACRKAIELDPTFAMAYSNLGAALADQGELDEAVAAHRKAIELDPKYARAYTNLGNALRGQKKLDEAVAAHRKAIELDPKDAPAHNNLGVALRHQKKLDEAVAAYRRAIELDPKDAAAYSNVGLALQGQGKLDEAIAAFRKAIELGPKDAAPYSNLGGLLCDDLKDYAAATENFRKAIELNSNFAEAYHNLGVALRGQKKLDEAVAAYRKAIELDPEFAGAYINLGVLLCDDLKDYDKAIECFHKAIELDPADASPYCNLGIALSGQGDDPGAIAAYRKAIALKPDYSLAHVFHWRQRDKAAADHVMADLWARPTPEFLDQFNVQAYVLRRDGDLEQARELRARVVEGAKTLFPSGDARVVKYQHDYIQLLLAMQRYEEAETVAGDALKSLPSEEAASRLMVLRSLANLYQQWNKPEEADRYQKLVHSAEAEQRASTTPTSEMRALDLNNRAWSLAASADPQTRDPHTAVELAQEAVKLAPNTADFWNTLGIAHYRDGNFLEAVSALQKYRELRTSDAEYSNPFFLAMAHWQLGDKDEARRWFDKGAQWMDAKNANSETMVRIRNEAAELLGLVERKE